MGSLVAGNRQIRGCGVFSGRFRSSGLAEAIQLWVNGELKQDSNSDSLIHDFVDLLAYLSLHVTLQPGDVILTGTPAGVGFPTKDFLHPGDVVRIEVEGCGVLENPVEEGI